MLLISPRGRVTGPSSFPVPGPSIGGASVIRSPSSASAHRWELSGNDPVLTFKIVIYCSVDTVGEFLLPHFLYNIYNNEKYYLGEPVHIHIQSFINTTKSKRIHTHFLDKF